MLVRSPLRTRTSNSVGIIRELKLKIRTIMLKPRGVYLHASTKAHRTSSLDSWDNTIWSDRNGTQREGVERAPELSLVDIHIEDAMVIRICTRRLATNASRVGHASNKASLRCHNGL